MVVAHNEKTYYFRGLSTDTKPTLSTINTGSRYLEIDTGKRYMWSGTAWVEFISTGGGGGSSEPEAYLKYAEISEDSNTLVLTDNDDNTLEYSDIVNLSDYIDAKIGVKYDDSMVGDETDFEYINIDDDNLSNVYERIKNYPSHVAIYDTWYNCTLVFDIDRAGDSYVVYRATTYPHGDVSDDWPIKYVFVKFYLNWDTETLNDYGLWLESMNDDECIADIQYDFSYPETDKYFYQNSLYHTLSWDGSHWPSNYYHRNLILWYADENNWYWPATMKMLNWDDDDIITFSGMFTKQDGSTYALVLAFQLIGFQEASSATPGYYRVDIVADKCSCTAVGGSNLPDLPDEYDSYRLAAKSGSATYKLYSNQSSVGIYAQLDKTVNLEDYRTVTLNFTSRGSASTSYSYTANLADRSDTGYLEFQDTDPLSGVYINFNDEDIYIHAYGSGSWSIDSITFSNTAAVNYKWKTDIPEVPKTGKTYSLVGTGHKETTYELESSTSSGILSADLTYDINLDNYKTLVLTATYEGEDYTYTARLDDIYEGRIAIENPAPFSYIYIDFNDEEPYLSITAWNSYKTSTFDSITFNETETYDWATILPDSSTITETSNLVYTVDSLKVLVDSSVSSGSCHAYGTIPSDAVITDYDKIAVIIEYNGNVYSRSASVSDIHQSSPGSTINLVNDGKTISGEEDLIFKYIYIHFSDQSLTGAVNITVDPINYDGCEVQKLVFYKDDREIAWVPQEATYDSIIFINYTDLVDRDSYKQLSSQITSEKVAEALLLSKPVFIIVNSVYYKITDIQYNGTMLFAIYHTYTDLTTTPVQAIGAFRLNVSDKYLTKVFNKAVE